jgi:hypothetical protein
VPDHSSAARRNAPDVSHTGHSVAPDLRLAVERLVGWSSSLKPAEGVGPDAAFYRCNKKRGVIQLDQAACRLLGPQLFKQQTPGQQAFPTGRDATQMRGSRRATNVNEPKRSLRKSAGCYGPTILNL